MALPLVPLIGLGAAGAGAALMNDADKEKKQKSRAKDAAVVKYYNDTINERYGAKGAEMSNRDMSSEMEESDMLEARAKQHSAIADTSTPRPPRRELNEDQRRSMAREAERRSTFGPTQDQRDRAARGMKKGGVVKMSKGGFVSSASRRADGCATKGKTKGMMVKMKSGGMCK
jgi:hypothetical protein